MRFGLFNAITYYRRLIVCKGYQFYLNREQSLYAHHLYGPNNDLTNSWFRINPVIDQ
jgi:hypothetical protein